MTAPPRPELFCKNLKKNAYYTQIKSTNEQYIYSNNWFFMKLWIKNPLSILAENAGGGIVVEGNKIVELVPSGANPSLTYDSVFDASSHVVLPGPVSYTHLTLPTILLV